MTRRLSLTVTSAASVAVLGALAACGSSGQGTSSGSGTASESRINVVASFYPLAYALERVGGSRVSVTNLTGPGVDPHHLELTPQQVAQVSDASLVVYASGMQPAADSAIKGASPKAVLDVSSLADLSASQTQVVGGTEAEHDHGHDHGHDHDHATTATSAASGTASATTSAATASATTPAGEGGTRDPHFWLDPERYGKAVGLIADELGKADPAGAGQYTANAKAFQQELSTLNSALASGLKNCARKQLVTGHTAFAYLAQRYGFQQVGLAGVLNESEPDPARLAQVSDYVKKNGVTTVYAEAGETSASIQTIAGQTGVKVATLDNVATTSGDGYVKRMEANLGTLRSGQGCS